MSTSLTSPALVLASNQAIIAAAKAIAKAKLFATDFSSQAIAPGTTLKIPVFTHGTAANFDAAANNYGNTEGTVTWVEITFGNHPKHTFSFTEEDFQLADGTHFWANAGTSSGEAVGLAIVTAIAGLINKTNIPKTGTGTAANEVVLASVTKATVAALRASCAAAGIDPANTVLMLQPTQFAALLALLDANVYGGAEAIKAGMIPGLYGFKAVMENSYLSSAAAEKLVGALVPADAIAIAGRTVKANSTKAYDEIGSTTDPASGLTLTSRRFTDPKTGESFATVESVFGAGIVQSTKIVRLVSEATA